MIHSGKPNDTKNNRSIRNKETTRLLVYAVMLFFQSVELVLLFSCNIDKITLVMLIKNVEECSASVTLHTQQHMNQNKPEDKICAVIRYMGRFLKAPH